MQSDSFALSLLSSLLFNVFKGDHVGGEEKIGLTTLSLVTCYIFLYY
jgi:hypothetical protein